MSAYNDLLAIFKVIIPNNKPEPKKKLAGIERKPSMEISPVFGKLVGGRIPPVLVLKLYPH